MENIKRAIILDMDETLEHGIFHGIYNVGKGLTMILRPNLDELITKLREVKKQGVDIILCTTAHNSWVERFFILKPEFRDVFDKKYTRNNEEEWKNYSKKDYPLEYKATSENINLEYSKPITTFGYEQILFIDNSKIEELRLKILFEITQGKLEKDVTFFSAFGFNGGSIKWDKILRYKELAKQNLELSKKLKEYIEVERNEIGCKIMCLVIDRFMKKEFKVGLTLIDDDYSKEYKAFNTKITLLKEKLKELSWDLEDDLIDNSNNELKELLKVDKKYLYEGIF